MWYHLGRDRIISCLDALLPDIFVRVLYYISLIEWQWLVHATYVPNLKFLMNVFHAVLEISDP